MREILVVTDHRTHYPRESVFPICRALARRPDVNFVAVVSRGLHRNSEFFSGNTDTFLAQRIDENFFIDRWDWHSNLLQFYAHDFNIAFLRIDRPFDTEFAVGIKRSLSGCGHVVNDIDGILRTRLKSFVAGFDKFIPPSRVCSNADEISEFVFYYDEVVLKPDDSYAAKGIVRLNHGSVDGPDFTGTFSEYCSRILAYGAWPRVAVKFLKRITAGDKRLLIANGRLVSSLLRVPQQGGWLVNYASGRTVSPSCPTKREEEIIEYVSTKMRRLGVFIYSIDTIEDDDGQRLISEINSLNPGLLAFSEGINQDMDAIIVADELIRFTNQSSQ